MNADLHMAGELKNTGNGNLFVIFGEPDIDILDAGDGQLQARVNGVDVFHPNTGEVRSDGPEGIACWFIDTDYNQESFFVRHAYFLGASDPYKSLNHPTRRDRCRRLGHPEQRHLPPVPKAGFRPHSGEGNQSPGRRGDEGVPGRVKGNRAHPKAVEPKTRAFPKHKGRKLIRVHQESPDH